MPKNNNFGKRLKELRKKAGLTQEKFCKMLDVSIVTVKRWEKGIRSPRIEEVKRITSVLNITEADLLNGPPNDTWTLEIKFDNSNSNKELINMVGDMPCISSITGTAKGAVLTLSGKWDTFRDDAKFQDFIDQLVKARDKILRLGEDWTD